MKTTQIENIINGLKILQSYDANAEIESEHNHIFVYLNKSVSARLDFRMLNDYGWFCSDNANKHWEKYL